MGWAEEFGLPFGAIPAGGAVGPQLVAIIKAVTDTQSWVVPRTSLYTIRMWGSGASGLPAAGGTGSFTRITKALTKGDVYAITGGKPGRANSTSGGGGQYFDGTAMTFSGPGINLVANTGISGGGTGTSVATGGDLNLPGINSTGNIGPANAPGDGTVIGTGGRQGDATFDHHNGYAPGGSGLVGRLSPGFSSTGGEGEIRIVDETP